ncbi:MAG: hypothetical protein M0Q38_01340 [Bacteroidales bacterium]|jgi:hypothetical protein|nr:hypothetical protein [Bacteroidales bacterium]
MSEEPELKVIQQNVLPETIKKLGHLLNQVGIKEAYFIDDYNINDVYSIIAGHIRTLHGASQTEKVIAILNNDINFTLPDIDVILEDFLKKWETFDDPKKSAIYKSFAGLNDTTFEPDDYDKTHELKNIFEERYLKLIGPEEWRTISKDIDKKITGTEKVLLIFDQDLTKAIDEEFTTGRTKGNSLILEVKNTGLGDKAFCILITHTISSVHEEFQKRGELAKEIGLDTKDFFALTKQRISTPELICDGIKKAILDKYFEKIKSESLELVTKVQTDVLEGIKSIDTYDFDQSVLISSNEEGVWEVETLLRFFDILYNQKIREFMFSSSYPKTVNPDIKQAKKISDIRFEVKFDSQPNKDSDKLRRAEIYLESKILNSLHLPLGNGDIFEVYEGDNKGNYILVAQECDLMMRSDGKRGAEFATLLKIDEKNNDEVDKLIMNFQKLYRNQNSYLANKFLLDCYSDDNQNIGVVNLKKPILVDLNVLDLCVFNQDGEASSLALIDFDQNLISSSWESRLPKLKTDFEKMFKTIKDLREDIKNLATETAGTILLLKAKKISLNSSLGKIISLEENSIKYGIKRVRRLHNPYARNLLSKYALFTARTPELHNFTKK